MNFEQEGRQMRLVSCNAGKPILVQTARGSVLTGIFKTPVHGPVKVGRLNIQGDQQADLTVHGGFHKAVYAYPSEHYAYWREELPGTDLPWGMFGENLTTEGLLENEVHIGDRFRIGSALLQVTQPRMPCYKLALKFNRADMIKLFWKSGHSGFYFSVVEEGELQAGDSIDLERSADPRVTVAEVLALYRHPSPDRADIERALAAPLTAEWKQELRERLWAS
jgi:MOSC domain-containing protein YiiM